MIILYILDDTTFARVYDIDSNIDFLFVSFFESVYQKLLLLLLLLYNLYAVYVYK